MTLADSSARSRIAALSLLVLVLVGFFLGPVSAYVDLLQSGFDKIDQKAALLQRYRALAATSDQPKPAMVARESEILIADLPESQAVAQLQETVKTAASASQVQIRGFQVLRSEQLASAVRFGVRVRASGDVASLERLLYAISSARPLLISDNLQVQSHTTPGGPPSNSLEFQVDISGFRALPSS